MSIQWTAAIASLIVLGIVFYLLSRRQLREKYAILWLFLGVCGVILATAPVVLFTVSDWLGFQAPVNLFFCLVVVVLLIVSMQFSLELGRLTEKARRLAEQTAIDEAEIVDLRRRVTALEQALADKINDRQSDLLT